MMPIQECEKCGETYIIDSYTDGCIECASKERDALRVEVAELRERLNYSALPEVVESQGPCPGGCGEQTRRAGYCLVCQNKRGWAEVAEYDALFDMQQKRMTEATAWWQEFTGEHDTLPDLGDLLATMLLAIERSKVEVERLEREKCARIYYQDIVYAVCNALDELSDGIGPKIVCGTLETPTTEVQDAMRRLVDELDNDTMRVIAKAMEGKWTVPVGKARWKEINAEVERLTKLVEDGAIAVSTYLENPCDANHALVAAFLYRTDGTPVKDVPDPVKRLQAMIPPKPEGVVMGLGWLMGPVEEKPFVLSED